jgi:transposase
MSDVDTKAKRRNKRWPEAVKREIVAATLQPGASVSVVARQYDVNANQVFSWRRRYGEAEKAPTALPAASGLVPVTIVADAEGEAATRPAPAVPYCSDTIEIEVGGDCRIRVGSGFDGRALKRVLDVLRKR